MSLYDNDSYWRWYGIGKSIYLIATSLLFRTGRFAVTFSSHPLNPPKGDLLGADNYYNIFMKNPLSRD